MDTRRRRPRRSARGIDRRGHGPATGRAAADATNSSSQQPVITVELTQSSHHILSLPPIGRISVYARILVQHGPAVNKLQRVCGGVVPGE